MAKTPRSRSPNGRASVTRGQITELGRDIAKLRERMADIDRLRQDCAANLRRCGELQHEIDQLKKRLPNA
jgi:predicted  nucleic acid-binding Zn-ribbon protein